MAAHMPPLRCCFVVLAAFAWMTPDVNLLGQSGAAVVLDNARVRVFRTTGASLAGVGHGPGVVVPLVDGPTRKAGDAYWAEDAAIARDASSANPGALIVVEPKTLVAGAAPPAGSKPGDAAFVGMSFKTLFENEKLTAIRARMEVGAREGFHTHGSDTLVVHLSGGAIEDTADGTTKVNRWKPGDVEFESRGSSHSARNVGGAVDVVLVALKP
jgi:quercetin dioxygenase-like cupin family protein